MTTVHPTESRNDHPWRGFTGQVWRDHVDVAAFIRDNHRPYDGDAAFLAGPTDRTSALWGQLASLFAEERRRGIYDVDAATPATITSHAPGLHRPRPRADRRPADRRAAAAGDHAQRRAADGRGRAATPTATSSTRA